MRKGKRKRVTLVVSAVALAGLFLTTSVVRAAEEPNKGKISLSAGVDFPTAYFFRGILQENGGFIAQPYMDTTITVYEGSGGLNSVSATLGIWNSFQENSPGKPEDPTGWYEADLYGGLTFGLLDHWEAGVTYTAYVSPNDSFDTVQEISFSLSFDDSDLLGPFALSPTILVAFETDGQADGGSHEGVYMELGIAPGFTLIESESYPVSLSFPVKVGLSLDDYYEFRTGDDDTFGYFDGGIVASMPLGFIPADYGSWEISAGIHILVLGDNLEATNDGDEVHALGIFGISMTY